jgi:hypothetical protein
MRMHGNRTPFGEIEDEDDDEDDRHRFTVPESLCHATLRRFLRPTRCRLRFVARRCRDETQIHCPREPQTGGRFYDALALLAVTAALRGVEERPFDAGVTAGMGRVVREIDGLRGGEG